jgi:hypothetical protein
MFVSGIRPAVGASPRRVAVQSKRLPYYRALREVARRNNGVFLDVGPQLVAKAEALHRQHPLHTIYADGTHYNALGALILAGEVFRALRVTI